MKKIMLLSVICFALSAVPVRAQDMTPMPGEDATPAPAPKAQQQPITYLAPVSVGNHATKPAIPKNTPSPTERMRQMFHAMDRNNDGQVTFEEFSSAYDRFYPFVEDPADRGDKFAVLDANKDGVVTLKEFMDNYCMPVLQNYTMRWVPNGARSDNND